MQTQRNELSIGFYISSPPEMMTLALWWRQRENVLEPHYYLYPLPPFRKKKLRKEMDMISVMRRRRRIPKECVFVMTFHSMLCSAAPLKLANYMLGNQKKSQIHVARGSLKKNCKHPMEKTNTVHARSSPTIILI